jgi:hypothetical protein
MKKKEGKWLTIFLLCMIPAFLHAGVHLPHTDKKPLRKLNEIRKKKIRSDEAKAVLAAECNITVSVISK